MPHVNPTGEQRTACAPYNFIPLPERVVEAVKSFEDLPHHNRFDTKEYPNTGYLDIELTTESPLYIRGPLTRAERRNDLDGNYRDGSAIHDKKRPEYKKLAKNKEDFFYIDPQTRQPVISGSSLRGMLRTVFEIITFSKFSRFDDENLIYRAVGDTTSLGSLYRSQTIGPNKASNPQRDMVFDYPIPSLKGGYLRDAGNGRWEIQPAKEFHGESFIHVEYSSIEAAIGDRGRHKIHDVFVIPGSRSSTNRGQRGGRNLKLELAVTSSCVLASSAKPAASQLARLVESGHMGRPKGQQPLPHQKHMHCAIYEADPDSQRLAIPEEMWRLYMDDSENSPQGGVRLLRSEGDPLFYLVDSSGELVFFGPTMFFRLPYPRRLGECVPDCLQDRSKIDYTDAVWGIEPENGQAQKPGYSSRVRVGDAHLVQGQTDIFETTITPKILASPKATCFQHYIEQDAPDDKADLNHYGTPFENEDRVGNRWQPVIRGREPRIRGSKRFWHQQSANLASAQGVEPQDGISTQLTRLKPVKKGVKFRFRINFVNLSDFELGALLWTVHPSGSKESVLAHKLGMAKPYGFGTVKLRIDSAVQIDRSSRYQQLVNEKEWDTGVSVASEDDLSQKVNTFLQGMGNKLDSNQDVSSILRIRSLIEMMKLPGLPVLNGIRAGNARYMTIAPNEYKERPVLPDPLGVLGIGTQTATATPNSPQTLARVASQSRPTASAREFKQGDSW